MRVRPRNGHDLRTAGSCAATESNAAQPGGRPACRLARNPPLLAPIRQSSRHRPRDTLADQRRARNSLRSSTPVRTTRRVSSPDVTVEPVCRLTAHRHHASTRGRDRRTAPDRGRHRVPPGSSDRRGRCLLRRVLTRDEVDQSAGTGSSETEAPLTPGTQIMSTPVPAHVLSRSP